MRRTTATTQAAIVSQSKKTGNQPATMEMLPTFIVVTTMTTAIAAAATTQAISIQPRAREGLVACSSGVPVLVLVMTLSAPRSQLLQLG